MRNVIASLQNLEIKRAISLQKRKQREQEGLFIVEGLRLSEDAFRSGWKISIGFFSEGALVNSRAMQLMDKLRAAGEKIRVVTDNVYNKLTETEKPQGIMLVVKKQNHGLEFLHERQAEQQTPVYIVLDRIQDPGNVGAIIRTAEAAGCAAVFAVKGTADIFSSKTVRSTMGSLFRLPVIADVSKEAVVSFVEKHVGTLLVTALDETARPYFSTDYLRPVAIVFGNEANGVDAYFLEVQCEKLYIPMRGGAESLNVAASASIVIYEAVRQQMTLLK